jgi:hypothetical protein
MPPAPILSRRRYGPNCVPSAIVIVPAARQNLVAQQWLPAVYQRSSFTALS